MLFGIPEFDHAVDDLLGSAVEAGKHKAGKNFEVFIAEFLNLVLSASEHSSQHQLRPLNSSGKDGAIDHAIATPAGIIVVECKHSPDPKIAWEPVAKRLQQHLADPQGPTTGQSQYRPWYQQGAPQQIIGYRLYFSGHFHHLAQRQQITQQITDFFAALAQKTHLAHLAELAVEVISWDDIAQHLPEYPSLVQRWFPQTQISGLSLFAEATFSTHKLRGYLQPEVLPYLPYPQQQHHPQQLLAQLQHNNTAGLVITGAGGVGKTRLGAEIARLAQRDPLWLVLQVGVLGIFPSKVT